MGILNFLETESGQPITTESGQNILVQPPYIDDDTIQAFDFSINLLQALLWQYNAATNLQGLLNAKAEWYLENQTDFWQNWYNDVFNLATCNLFGCAVWSVILNQPIFVNNGPTPSGVPIWGLSSNNQNFGNGNFGSANGYTYNFSLPIARLLLQLRYFQLVSSGTIPETNRMLKYLFEETYGPAVLIDGNDMTQRYIFDFEVPSEMALMFSSFDVLPRPAAVKSTVMQGGVDSFGFGVYHANLGNGNFSDGTITVQP